MLTILIKNNFLFLYLAECDAALGFEDLEVWDSQLTAQSNPIHISLQDGNEMDTHARCGRLNLHYCAFCGSSENGQYLEVDLRQDYKITAVATQGFEALNKNYFVKGYNLSCSRDGRNWSIFPVSINLTFSEISGNNELAIIILIVILIMIRRRRTTIIIALTIKFKIFVMIHTQN